MNIVLFRLVLSLPIVKPSWAGCRWHKAANALAGDKLQALVAEVLAEEYLFVSQGRASASGGYQARSQDALVWRWWVGPNAADIRHLYDVCTVSVILSMELYLHLSHSVGAHHDCFSEYPKIRLLKGNRPERMSQQSIIGSGVSVHSGNHSDHCQAQFTLSSGASGPGQRWYYGTRSKK